MKTSAVYKFHSEVPERMWALGFTRRPVNFVYEWVSPTKFPGADLHVSIDIGPSTKNAIAFCRFDREHHAPRLAFWDIFYTLPDVNPSSGKDNLLVGPASPEESWERIEAHIRRLTGTLPDPIVFRVHKSGKWWRVVIEHPTRADFTFYLCREGEPKDLLSHYPTSDPRDSRIVEKPTKASAVAYGRALGLFLREEPTPAKKTGRSAR